LVQEGGNGKSNIWSQSRKWTRNHPLHMGSEKSSPSVFSTARRLGGGGTEGTIGKSPRQKKEIREKRVGEGNNQCEIFSTLHDIGFSVKDTDFEKVRGNDRKSRKAEGEEPRGRNKIEPRSQPADRGPTKRFPLNGEKGVSQELLRGEDAREKWGWRKGGARITPEKGNCVAKQASKTLR